MVMNSARYAVILAACFLLAACGFMDKYKGTSADNFTFRAEVNESEKVRAEVDIHMLDKKCNSTFAGRLKFGDEPVTVGIPENRGIVFVFSFVGEGFVNRNTRGIMNVYLKTRENHHYDVNMVYENSIFDAIFRETDLRTGKSQIIQPDNAGNCVPS